MCFFSQFQFSPPSHFYNIIFGPGELQHFLGRDEFWVSKGSLRRDPKSSIARWRNREKDRYVNIWSSIKMSISLLLVIQARSTSYLELGTLLLQKPHQFQYLNCEKKGNSCWYSAPLKKMCFINRVIWVFVFNLTWYINKSRWPLQWG